MPPTRQRELDSLQVTIKTNLTDQESTCPEIYR